MKRRIFLSVVFVFLVLAFCGSVSGANNNIQQISVSYNGSLLDGDSFSPAISADGRYVVFSSQGTNLVNDDDNNCSDVFIHDTILNFTERVSISNQGLQANGDSFSPAVSGDGRYVTFTSYASNLVADDTNDCADIFVRDRLLETTNRISISNSGEEGNADSFGSEISANGDCITFCSYANNLLDNDKNYYSDVFVFDRTQKRIKRISISNTGEESNSDSLYPDISGDGRYITFTSDANNLDFNDKNGCSDVFIFDQNLNLIKRIVGYNFTEANSASMESAISSDGRCIVFSSYADNLVPEDNNMVCDIFVFDQILNEIERVSVTSDGKEFSQNSGEPDISGDGRYVGFTIIQHFVQKVTNKGGNSKSVIHEDTGIFLYDRGLGTTSLISISNNGDFEDSNSREPGLSYNGTNVVFSSDSSNLVGNDTNNWNDIFIYEKSNYEGLIAFLHPQIVKSGDQVLIKAYDDPGTLTITAELFGEIKNLVKNNYGVWEIYFPIYHVPDGNYTVILRSFAANGDYETISLNLTVDNTPPTVTGNITPEMVQYGDSLIISAYSDSDTKRIKVNILGETLQMHQDYDVGMMVTWILHYFVPDFPDGNYPVILTAIDEAGNIGFLKINLTINNDVYILSASLTPEIVKTFDQINITVNSNHNTVGISALILDEVYQLTKQTDDTWNLQYCVPYLPNGNYSVLLTAENAFGSQKYCYLYFEIFNQLDNICPILNASITPNPCYLINGIFKDKPLIVINVSTDTDTISLNASIEEDNIGLIRQLDGSWLGYYEAWLQEGFYPLLLTATDWSGNQGYSTLNLAIENLVPTINVTVDPKRLKGDEFFKLTVSTNPDAGLVYVYTTMDWDYTDLIKQTDGSWILRRVAPSWFQDHEYSILVIVQFGMGWADQNTPLLIEVNYVTSVIVDSCAPFIFGFVVPEDIKSGDPLRIVAQVYPSKYLTDDTCAVKAQVFDEVFNLTKVYGDENRSIWEYYYLVPPVIDGVYPIFLTTFDDLGNNRTQMVYFTVDNTPPPIITRVNTQILKSGDTIVVYIDDHPDIKNISAEIVGEKYSTPQELDEHWGYLFRGWILDYKVPPLPDGIYNILLTAVDFVGNKKVLYIPFTVDNTPPVVNGMLNPTVFKFFDFRELRKLTVTAVSSPDTNAVYAIIDGIQRSLIYSNGQWVLEHRVPHILNIGSNLVTVVAIDYAGNQGILYLYFNVVGFSTINLYYGESGHVLSGSNGNYNESGNSVVPGGNIGGSGGGGGAEGGFSGGISGQSSSGPSINLMDVLLIILIVCLILILVIVFAAELMAFLWILIGIFMGFIEIISWLVECMACFMGSFFSALLFVNPFALILNVLALVFNPSPANILDLALTWTGAYLFFMGASELSLLIEILSDVTFPLVVTEVLDGVSGWMHDRKNEIIHFIKKIN